MRDQPRLSETMMVPEPYDPWVSIAHKWPLDSTTPFTLFGAKFDLKMEDRPQRSLWVYSPCELPIAEHFNLNPLYYSIAEVILRERKELDGKYLPIIRQAAVAYLHTLNTTIDIKGDFVVLFVPDVTLEDLPALTAQARGRRTLEIDNASTEMLVYDKLKGDTAGICTGRTSYVRGRKIAHALERQLREVSNWHCHVLRRVYRRHDMERALQRADEDTDDDSMELFVPVEDCQSNDISWHDVWPAQFVPQLTIFNARSLPKCCRKRFSYTDRL